MAFIICIPRFVNVFSIRVVDFFNKINRMDDLKIADGFNYKGNRLT